MPSKRQILSLLGRNDLIDLADEFDLEVSDRRVRDNLIDALASSHRATLPDILGTLPRAVLKELCRGLDLDDSGREKQVLIDRLLGKKVRKAARKPVTAPVSTKQPDPSPKKTKPKKERKAKTSNKKTNGATLGFEATLWKAAEKLRSRFEAILVR